MFIAIDIGGTKTTIGLYKNPDPANQLNLVTYPTPKNYPDALNLLISQINTLLGQSTLTAVGLSIATRLLSNGTISNQNNLADYDGRQLSQDLSQLLKHPVYAQNDAACAARAEMAFGHGKHLHSLLHIIMGTGFGGAFVLKSQNRVISLPLEPGSMIIQPGGMPHTQYQIKGLLEAYLAGRQLEAQVAQPLSEVSDDHLIWQQVSHYLATALINLTVLFQPEMITFSGSLIKNRSFLLTQAQTHSQTYQELVTLPSLKLSQITGNPSLIGALTLCQE